MRHESYLDSFRVHEYFRLFKSNMPTLERCSDTALTALLFCRRVLVSAGLPATDLPRQEPVKTVCSQLPHKWALSSHDRALLSKQGERQ